MLDLLKKDCYHNFFRQAVNTWHSKYFIIPLARASCMLSLGRLNDTLSWSGASPGLSQGPKPHMVGK
jgi:hypothetical protein